MSRNSVFISYATEDARIATWLASRLVSEGYDVWMDRTKLLGGESYPRSIDYVLKHETACVLALLSRSSIGKANPVKERTLALNIARERRMDFLVPLNIDGLSPTELDWMTSDITFIPFQDWPEGFRQVLRKLQSLRVPKSRPANSFMLSERLTAVSRAADREETVWSNLFPIVELPSSLFLLTLGRWRESSATGQAVRWVSSRRNDQQCFAFGLPPEDYGREVVDSLELNWTTAPSYERTDLTKVVSNLITRHLTFHCTDRGMGLTPPPDRLLYFRSGQLSKGRLRYVDPRSGKNRWTKVVGNRFSDSCRYHLGFETWPSLRDFGDPAVGLTLRFLMTQSDDSALSTERAFTYERRLRSTMHNADWSDRLAAISYWLSNGEESIDLSPGQQYHLVLSALPIRLQSPKGIDENTTPFQEDAGIEPDTREDQEEPWSD